MSKCEVGKNTSLIVGTCCEGSLKRELKTMVGQAAAG
jgi:hypothetical protein